MPYAMEYLDKVRKVLCFLVECLSPWIAMGRRNVPIQHFLAKRLTIIGAEEIDDNKALIKAVNG